MAWLYQRGNRYYIGYYTPDGKRVRKSVSTSKEVAEMALKRIEADIEGRDAGMGSVPEAAVGVVARHLGEPEYREKLSTYPGVRCVENVRELFIRIYDKIGFEVLKSQAEFPHYVLSRQDRILRAHAALKSSDLKPPGLDLQKCDMGICWIHDWPDAPIPILDLSAYFDFYG
jgi:hypothetical protein